jgi:hypothetical protein
VGGRGLPAGAHGGSALHSLRSVPASLVLGGRGRSRQYSLRLKAPLRHLPRVSGSNGLRSLRSLAAPTPARPSRPTNRSPPAIPCRREAPLFGVLFCRPLCHCGSTRNPWGHARGEPTPRCHSRAGGNPRRPGCDAEALGPRLRGDDRRRSNCEWLSCRRRPGSPAFAGMTATRMTDQAQCP